MEHDEYIQLYNDGYRPILGAKHPQALGISTEKHFSRNLAHHRDVFDGVMKGNLLVFRFDVTLKQKQGFVEEYFQFCIQSYKEDGEVGGVLVYCNWKQPIKKKRQG
jgi:hypothetical protein